VANVESAERFFNEAPVEYIWLNQQNFQASSSLRYRKCCERRSCILETYVLIS
jgi:hypothetical protein